MSILITSCQFRGNSVGRENPSRMDSSRQPHSSATSPARHASADMDEKGEPVIIGGMVLDIHATPSVPADLCTTTPGKVEYMLGGVARNIAECMSKLQTKPYMISAVGVDVAGNILLDNWKSSGLSIEGIQRCKSIGTAIVSNTFDVKGELVVGVASLEVIEKFLTPEWIKHFNSNICSAPIIMVDANLSPRALEMSCQMAAKAGVHVWFEPVSVVKSRRVVSVAKHISFASPNEHELIAMANALSHEEIFTLNPHDFNGSQNSVESLFQKLKPAIWVLLEKGIEAVIVTVGSNGVFLCSKRGRKFWKSSDKLHNFDSSLYKLVNSSCGRDHFFGASKFGGDFGFFAMHFPALPASVVRVSGAGDCLVGGTLAALSTGLNIMQSISVGIAAAKTSIEVDANVPSEFSLAKIAEDARTVYFAGKDIFCQSML
ncbi:pseudouridine kinase [Impatiens glandulifera]|uniref:pseudouridine kinase n=1 Tax=Impatiens glandulifera TaxID=253017 RepID=UPI001FB17932|nr:pseudouridine kinase [Impatiens glandulifera]XP_047309272.1 pseudouridine kinase [Impatiens glandulifera]XP_047309274.1 pseudouridine kinase [Impatiens glandulifera]XP_047309275.1 pseudouridine kinase [Impatiens glandulifera]